MADVGREGMYVNIAPYGVTRLKEECDKLKRDVNVLALPTWGIHSSATGGSAMMAYPVNYCPVEKTELGVRVAHLPVLEALGVCQELPNLGRYPERVSCLPRDDWRDSQSLHERDY